MPDLHIHVPERFSGTVHIHHNGDVTTIAPQPETGFVQGSSTGADADEVETILARHEQYDSRSRSRHVCQALVNDGWEAAPHKTRDGNARSDASYVRLTYRGSAQKIVVYLNSRTLSVYGKAVQEFAARLPGADVKSRGNVYFTHSEGDDLERAVSNAAALRALADGERTTAQG